MGARTRNKPCDSNYCFFIQDFQVGDALIVREGGRYDRTKAVVSSVDSKRNLINYSKADGTAGSACLDDIVYLGPGERDWLEK